MLFLLTDITVTPYSNPLFKLGLAGFGLGVSSFASQSATIELHTPELALARTRVLDYFLSAHQKKLAKIFAWEVEYQLSPGRNLIKFLRMVQRETGHSCPTPHLQMCDASPDQSLMAKVIFGQGHICNR